MYSYVCGLWFSYPDNLISFFLAGTAPLWQATLFIYIQRAS